MKIVTYQKQYNVEDSIENFQRVYYNSQMKCFASDLLDKGLSPNDVTEAVQRAITVGKASGLNINKHFIPVYTHRSGWLVKDCKLSKLGYALVLMNANPNSPIVGEWQLRVLNKYFE